MNHTLYATLSAAVFSGLVGASAAVADTSTTSAFLGMELTFGQSASGTVSPDIYVGIAHGNASPYGNVTGAKATVAWDFTTGLTPSKVKLSGLAGRTYLQGEVGAGYSIAKGTPFFVGGVNGNHYAVGAEYYPNSGIGGYAGVQTLGSFKH
ncbi:hypothetical protein GALL_502460 [mine drainage metagenome]|uniref:Uncharacterized protein n=1 Tax=mine drainage metagenome TaxID=410659 RepID=A0A1J5PX18_9ZZZZ